MLPALPVKTSIMCAEQHTYSLAETHTNAEISILPSPTRRKIHAHDQPTRTHTRPRARARMHAGRGARTHTKPHSGPRGSLSRDVAASAAPSSLCNQPQVVVRVLQLHLTRVTTRLCGFNVTAVSHRFQRPHPLAA